MAIVLTWEDRGLLVQSFGFVSRSACAEVMKEVHADPRFDYIEYVIADNTEISGIESDFDDADLYAAYGAGAAPFNPSLLVAFIAPDDKVRQWGAYFSQLSPHQFGIFTSLKDAHNWLQSKLFLA